jgi:hypothetical protein
MSVWASRSTNPIGAAVHARVADRGALERPLAENYPSIDGREKFEAAIHGRLAMDDCESEVHQEGSKLASDSLLSSLVAGHQGKDIPEAAGATFVDVRHLSDSTKYRNSKCLPGLNWLEEITLFNHVRRKSGG